MRQETGQTLDQMIMCFFTTPIAYLKQYWLLSCMNIDSKFREIGIQREQYNNVICEMHYIVQVSMQEPKLFYLAGSVISSAAYKIFL